MTDQHRATPEDWAFVERHTPLVHCCSCIRELCDRIQQLEAAQQQLRSEPTTGLLFKTETTHGEASDHARRLVRDANSIPATVEGSFELGGKVYTYKGQAEPAPSCQQRTLLDRVEDAIDKARPGYDTAMSRAAIREVAAWLREGNAAATAYLLERESDR